MNFDEVTNLLNSLQINSTNKDDVTLKIINLMYESSEVGLNNLKYHFTDTTQIQYVKNNLLTHFPDIDVRHIANTNYIFIDWS
jgi:hypothetical protein